jgi:integrase
MPLNPDEVNRFLETIKGDPLEAVFHAALSFGLREGEVLRLR